ncbi:hypothetical protein QTP88_022072 [Uroleucon formosanum]
MVMQSEESDSDVELDPDNLIGANEITKVHTVETVDEEQTWKEAISINGWDVEFKLDTGSQSCNGFGLVKKESIGEIKRVDNDDEERDKFVKEHKVIFDCMGTFPTKYNIKTVNNAGGVINPPRRVPLTILERLKIELLKLDKNKIIEKLEEPKEWRPFGLSCAPEAFIKQSKECFAGINNAINYFDDYYIATESKKEHDAVLNQIVTRAKNLNIRFNLYKLPYGNKSVQVYGPCN